MSKNNVLVTYATRLSRREWRRFVLPFLSLAITTLVLSLTLLLTSASSRLIADQARELLGGDVVVESNAPIDTTRVLERLGTVPNAESKQLSFTATIASEGGATAVSIRAVDAAYPLYGSVTMEKGAYAYPNEDEIILDQAGAEQLRVGVGESVQFGEATYIVSGIVVTEPTSIITGFRFLPRVLMSKEGFDRAMVDPALFRPEYEYAVAVDTMGEAVRESLRALSVDSDGLYQVRVAGDERRGLQSGLGTVRDFLIVAVLITAVLATVNVYASTVYFLRVEQQSFAVILSLGLTSRRLMGVLGLALFYVVFLGNMVGILLAQGLFVFIQSLVEQQSMIALPAPQYGLIFGFTTVFIIGIALTAFAPTIEQLRHLQPKQLLGGAIDSITSARPTTLFFITAVTLLPFLVASSWLLGSVVQGGGIVLGVIIGYVLIASLFLFLLVTLHRMRAKFPFFIRSIIAHKRADGLFGIISFTSLFVALTAFVALVLIQVSVREYLVTDLSRTVPSTYVLDVQPSQKDLLLATFPDLVLFSNTPARIIAIDEVRVQEELAAKTDKVDRELGREFNITARRELLESDRLTAGTPWTGQSGELSVDEDFALRAGISLGSRVVFSVQGIPLEGVVTSLRQSDSRSGMPFFYFVLSPEDLESFPVIYFGYGYQSGDAQSELSRFLADTMPNVSIIKTQTLTPLLIKITTILFLIIVVVAVPPLLIASLLIVTLIISSYSIRRLESARMRALGATTNRVLVQYLVETSTLTVSAAILGYMCGAVVTYGIVTYMFEFERVVLYSPVLILAFGIILGMVLGVGTYLFKNDKMRLSELLSYDSH